MMKEKRYYLYTAIILAILALIVIVFVPGLIKLILLILLYIGLLFIRAKYRQTGHTIIRRLDDLDRKQDFQAVLDYLNFIQEKGYTSFVYDSYGLYAHYVLGNFTLYEKLAEKMALAREWTRPKHEKFKEKVVDNLDCIAFLRQWADKGQVLYKGRNVILIQAVVYYERQEVDELKVLAAEHDMPKLKKACLYALLREFEMAQELYESEEAKLLFEKIKGREING